MSMSEGMPALEPAIGRIRFLSLYMTSLLCGSFGALLLTPNSPFERYVAGDSTALSEQAKDGLRLFIGKASCLDCHNGPALSDNQFHNIGVPTPAVFPPGTTTAGGTTATR